jgi:hypothetical protein
MELIERYVHEVARNLPRRIRDDVRAELRSLLTDALEERAAAAGRAADDEMVEQVLREFGKPDEVALRYQPAPQWLIGPELFPAYLFTARIVALVIAIVLGVFLGLGLLTDSARLPEFLRWKGVVSVLWEYARLVFVNLAIVTLVFAVLERTGAIRRGGKAKEEWNPRDLPKVEDPDRARVGELVFGVYGIVILFIVFNFYPEWFGLVFYTGDKLTAISYLDMGLKIPAALMNAWWVFALALNVAVLRMGRWTAEARWVEFALGLFGALILFLVLTESTVAVETMESLVSRGSAESEAMRTALERGLPWIARLFRTILMAMLAVTLVTAGVRLYRLLTRYYGAQVALL